MSSLWVTEDKSIGKVLHFQQKKVRKIERIYVPKQLYFFNKTVERYTCLEQLHPQSTWEQHSTESAGRLHWQSDCRCTFCCQMQCQRTGAGGGGVKVRKIRSSTIKKNKFWFFYHKSCYHRQLCKTTHQRQQRKTDWHILSESKGN